MGEASTQHAPRRYRDSDWFLAQRDATQPNPGDAKPKCVARAVKGQMILAQFI